MSVQTIIDFDSFHQQVNFLELNDRTFILYTRAEIFHFSKNLRWEDLLPFDENNYPNITSMKQLKNGKILCCNKDLHIYETKPKINKIKIIKMPYFNKGEEILDTIELKNGNIIGFTNQSIIKIDIKENIDENDEIIQLKKIKPILKDYDHISFLEFNLNLFELENNNLLLYLHKFYSFRRCLRCSPIIFYDNIIFILNLNNFKVVHKFENIKNKSNVVILKKYICMNKEDGIYIYDIINYKLIKKIKTDDLHYIMKYDENIIIGMNEYENNINISYDITDANNIKFQIIKMETTLEKYSGINLLIFKLNNGKILIYNHYIYIIEFKEKMNFIPLLEKKEKKGNKKKKITKKK